jgi:hypothetical protein
MVRTVRRILLIALLVPVSLTGLSVSYADVTVERVVKSAGIMGIGASETNQKEFIQKSKKRIDTSNKFTGSLLSKLVGQKDMSEVVNLDKDVTWQIDHSSKSYAELPIVNMTKSLEDGRAENTNHNPSESEDELDKENYRIVKNEIKLVDTGEKKKINGYSCRHYVLTWLVIAEDIETKERQKNVMTGNFWSTPEDKDIKALKQEEKTFNSLYLKKLGVDMDPEQIGRLGLNSLGSLIVGASKDLKKEMAKMKGYPIVSSVKWETSKEQTTDKQTNQGEGEGQNFAGGFGGIFGDKLKSMMGKEGSEDGELKTVFDSHSEIVSINVASIPKSVFEVPNGYKKSN